MDSVNKDEQAKRKGSTAPLPEQNIWNSILNEASRSVDRLEYRNVIVLGKTWRQPYFFVGFSHLKLKTCACHGFKIFNRGQRCW